MRRCRQGRRSWRSTSPATQPYAPRYRRSSSGMRRSAGRTGSLISGERHPRYLFQIYRGSGRPWKISSPGSQTSPLATPSHPNPPAEAVLVLARPRDQQDIPHWTPQPLQHHHPSQKLRHQQLRQSMRDGAVGAAASPTELAEEGVARAAEAGALEAAVREPRSI